jgi:hypothetical protein
VQVTRERTERITAVDISHGRTRIPIGEKEAFPEVPDRVTVRLTRTRLDDRAWEPGFGPDRERSGVLSIRMRLRQYVEADERLDIARLDGLIDLRRPQ